MKKFFPIFLIGCIIAIFTSCAIVFLSAPKSKLSRKLGVKLPRDTEIVYSYLGTEDSWFGDGTDYYVLRFEREPTELMEEFQSLNLKQGEDPDELKKDVMLFFDSAAVELAGEIPQEYLPTWEEECTWDDGGALKGVRAAYFPRHYMMYLCLSRS